MKLKIKSLFPAAVLLHLLHSVSFCQEIPSLIEQNYGGSDGCFVISGTSTWINTDGSLGKTTRFSWKYYHSLECQKALEKYENKDWIRYELSKSCSKCLNQKPNFDSGPRGSSIRLSSDTNHTDVNNHQRRVEDIVIPIEQNYTKDDIALLAEMQQNNLQTQADIEQLAEDYNNTHAGDFEGGRPSSLENFDDGEDEPLMNELLEALDYKEESQGVEVFYSENGDKTTFTDYDGDGHSDFKEIERADGSRTTEDLTEGRDGTDFDHDEAGYNYYDNSREDHSEVSTADETENINQSKLTVNSNFTETENQRPSTESISNKSNNSPNGNKEFYKTGNHTADKDHFQAATLQEAARVYSKEVTADLANQSSNWLVKAFRRIRIAESLGGIISTSSSPSDKAQSFVSISSALAPPQSPGFLLPVIYNANRNSLGVMGDQVGSLMNGRKLRTFNEVFRDMLFGRR
ncbi:MAG: hypothetical protein WBG42_00885 [Cryomorphaceae bacterium]